ncbi:hypothetical protein BM221_006934 [Beauveria bassiana]|uniref:Uncharacterized protein n=1 Tax=Beauveria bassiana TaxID=176275 RepID=A0A2N6NJ25_BEABA|nr:hypothetical protein BM221_006934 [Beauveria bassiana]
MRSVEPLDAASPSADKEQTSSTTERKPSPTTNSSLDSAVEHYAYEHFDRRRQLRQLLTKSLARWLITVVLCAAIYGVLLGYSSHDALPQRKKLEFNTLVIALTISLGLNIASSLKANAVELQWWLLSLRRYKPREADLIMSSEHFTTMLQLGWTTRHTLIQIFVVVFVTMNIGSQIALALLGITYNINPANHFAITKPGLVSIADLNDIQGPRVLAASKKRHEAEDVNSRRYSANLYGQFGSNFVEGGLDLAPKPGALYNPDDAQVFYSKELPLDSVDGNGSDGSAATKSNDNGNVYSYTYFFLESTLTNASYAGTVASNRSVTVTASCDSFKVVTGGNGTSSNITVRFNYGQDVVYLPVANGGSQILYLHDPATEANDTWSRVSAFEPSDTDPWFYQCQVSVGNVTNGFLPQHYMGTNFTRYIPPAIALQGYGASVSDIGLGNTTTNYQFQSYPLQTYFGQPAGGSGVFMASLVSRYAINALAVGALYNSNVDAPGMEPQRAIQLEITKWRYVHVIVGLTVGVQLIIQLVSVLVANRVQVREQRSLATAALLRPLLAGVGERASMARVKQIAKLIGKDVTVRYEPVGAGYDLRIYRNGQLEPFTPNTIDR